MKGSEILQRAVWRITHEDPLNAMGDKLYESEVKYKLLKLVKIKKLTDNNLLRKYFNRWKINALKGVDPYQKNSTNGGEQLELTHMIHSRKQEIYMTW